jgi:hypothetical protein
MGKEIAVTEPPDQLEAFLDRLYAGQERLTSGDIQRSAVSADLPADLLTRVDALPEGEYAVDEAAEALHDQ